jgi:hypothetical protein
MQWFRRLCHHMSKEMHGNLWMRLASCGGSNSSWGTRPYSSALPLSDHVIVKHLAIQSCRLYGVPLMEYWMRGMLLFSSDLVCGATLSLKLERRARALGPFSRRPTVNEPQGSALRMWYRPFQPTKRRMTQAIRNMTASSLSCAVSWNRRKRGSLTRIGQSVQVGKLSQSNLDIFEADTPYWSFSIYLAFENL